MTKEEEAKGKANFLEYMKVHHQGGNPLFRNWMCSEEIRWANQLVKEYQLTKGHSDPNGLVMFYYDERLQECCRKADKAAQ